MRVIIFSNGQISDYNFVKNNISGKDIIICCDGGIRHTKNLEIVPNYILGDLDSAPVELIKFYENLNVPFKKFPSKKDETDTEMGIILAIELGALEINLYGCIGTRFDHTLGNAHNLMIALKKGVIAKIIDEHNIIQIIDKDTTITGKKGQIISLIPMTTEVFGITTKNLEYPLNNETLKIGMSRGISNVMLEQTAEIQLKSGYLFLIYSKD